MSRSTSSSVSGRVSASKGMIGGDYVADDVKILDTSGTYNDDIPLYRSVYMQRLDGITLNSNSVLYSSKNSAGEIDELILKDVTGDTYTYGVVTKSNKAGMVVKDITKNEPTYSIETNEETGKQTVVVNNNETKIGVESQSYSGSYTAYVDGTEQTYGTNLSINANGPCRMLIDGNTVKSIQALVSYTSQISSLTPTEAEISGNKYLLSDDVVVYRKPKGTINNYFKIPVEDAISGNYRMTAYYDKAQSSGGRIRIIIAQDK